MERQIVEYVAETEVVFKSDFLDVWLNFHHKRCVFAKKTCRSRADQVCETVADQKSFVELHGPILPQQIVGKLLRAMRQVEESEGGLWIQREFPFNVHWMHLTLELGQNIHFGVAENRFVEFDAIRFECFFDGEDKGQLISRYQAISEMTDSETDDFVDFPALELLSQCFDGTFKIVGLLEVVLGFDNASVSGQGD